MAWHSSGHTNEELVGNLIENHQISSTVTAAAFRSVDRVHFVPKGSEDHAYSDRPLKEGNVHISAPHIYCTVVEALELEENSNMSFLNIGSGTGYLSCIVGQILGPGSQLFGVEIHNDVLQHCRDAITAWKNSRGVRVGGGNNNASSPNDPKFDFYHGNGFEIAQDEGESRIGYDRIYVGAQISAGERLNKIRSLLAPGGLLVAPVEDSLVKITRTGLGRATTNDRDNGDGIDDSEYITQEITGVHFAPLLTRPKIEVVIPATKWCPSNHRLYPRSFQDSIRAVLLCSSSSYIQAKPAMEGINMSAALPRDLWVHIFSFANRKWFEPENCEATVLRRRLRQEQSNAAEARAEVGELEHRLSLVQRERDLYLTMIRRWRSEIRRSIHQVQSQRENSESDVDLEEDSLYVSNQTLLNEANTILSSYFVRRQLMDAAEAMEEGDDVEDNGSNAAVVVPAVNQGGSDDDDDNDDDHHDDTSMYHESVSSDVMDLDFDDQDPRLGGSHEVQGEREDSDMMMGTSGSDHHQILSRPQIRSVSITHEDL